MFQLFLPGCQHGSEYISTMSKLLVTTVSSGLKTLRRVSRGC